MDCGNDISAGTQFTRTGWLALRTGGVNMAQSMIKLIASVRATLLCLFAASAAFPFVVGAQSFTLTNGVATYATLTNGSVVTLSNQCELRITGATTPITGCLIHLNSTDAYFVMQNIRPSVVVSSYLTQLRINGAVAVADVNCRVVQYGGAGTIVLPHSSTFQPLQVFSGPHFTGTSNNLSHYVYYKGTGLGAMNANISSFKLKRGYMATFAEFETGNGQSRNFVAADGDMEISILPDVLDNKVRFVFVTAWRWTSKKGIAGNIQSGLDLGWKYNWDNREFDTRHAVHPHPPDSLVAGAWLGLESARIGSCTRLQRTGSS